MGRTSEHLTTQDQNTPQSGEIQPPQDQDTVGGAQVSYKRASDTINNVNAKILVHQRTGAYEQALCAALAQAA